MEDLGDFELLVLRENERKENNDKILREYKENKEILLKELFNIEERLKKLEVKN